MPESTPSYSRRTLLRGALLTAVSVPLGVTLASCATGGGGGNNGGGNGTGGGEVTTKNPFGIAEGTEVEAVIFDGGYGVDYVEFAADKFNELYKGKAKVKPSTQIATELQPRFVAGDPPDLVDNSGAQAIGFGAILEQIETLDSVLDAPNLEGTTIRDTLVGEKILDSGIFDGALKAINYVLTAYAVWYSGSLFEENGWTPPTNWAEAIELGAKAKEKGKYLFCWGKEAATYYQTMAIDSAIIQGGDEVRLALENLEEGCWSHKAIQDVFTAMKTIVDNGYMKPGGSGTEFTSAQAQWSLDQDALMYPSGSWIENEMKDNTKDGFQMKGVAEWPVDSSAVMPEGTLRAEAGEPFIVPSKGNSAAGKEILRIMLSKDAAVNFAKTKLAPTIIKDTVPEDGFGSTALVSQAEMFAAAGDNIFTWKFVNLYGLNQAQLVVWNAFLDGSKSVEQLTSDLQAITDEARNTQDVIPVS